MRGLYVGCPVTEHDIDNLIDMMTTTESVELAVWGILYTFTLSVAPPLV